MIKYIIIGLLGLATANAATNTTETVKEQWALTLSGVGSTATSGDKSTAVGADISIGRTGHLLLPLEAGVRQKFAYSTHNDDVVAGTALYSDFTLFTLFKKVDMFVGGNVGAAYGNTPFVWTAAPEAGLRFWLKKDVALYGRAEFPFNLNSVKFNETITYVLGLQVRF